MKVLWLLLTASISCGYVACKKFKKDNLEEMFDSLTGEPLLQDLKVNKVPETRSPQKLVTAKTVASVTQSADPTDTLKRSIETMSRQIQMLQMLQEEKIRSDGQSGLKQIRILKVGSEPYHSAHHTSGAVGAIHDHANNIRTVGMGEFEAVLNGVEFRTRHNDYRLNMPHSTDGTYGAFEPIAFPGVPPEVLAKTNIDEQIMEMREWVKAWKDQNSTLRDYRKYFRPVLSYLEGAWTITEPTIDEPFDSDRHFIDASTWFELTEKVRFAAANGRKDNLENYAYLPTRLVDITNQSVPVFAQWNYRIMCIPLKDDLPLNRFRLNDDFSNRMARRTTLEEYALSRAAHFDIDPFDEGDPDQDGFIRYGLLDELMRQVPGKDNIPGDLRDDAFDDIALDMAPDANSTPLNVAYYSRWYKQQQKGAMGLTSRKRGFADEKLFLALTSQEKISGQSVTECKGRGKKRVCKTYEQRVSYAIPLEILYMTPLATWNPFGLAQKGLPSSEEGLTVTAGGRNGKKEKPFNGTHDRLHYITPSAFYSGVKVDSDAADTGNNKRDTYVLDKTGKARAVVASGKRIFLPEIPGVGTLRTRFPIMPIHGKGSGVWKELVALANVVLEPKKYSHMLREKATTSGTTTAPPSGTTTAPPTSGLALFTGKSSAETGEHQHEVNLTEEEVQTMKKGETVEKITGESNGHDHNLVLKHKLNKRGEDKFVIVKCNGVDNDCGDHHGRVLKTTKF